MVMCCYDLMFETFLFGDTINFVGYFIVYAVDDRSDVSFFKTFIASINTDYEISIFTQFDWVRPYSI